MLREMVRNFVRDRVEPQALENDREERFNIGLFREMGSMGLLGLTVPPEYGGAGMDATSVAIVNEELSYSDPGLCLAFLAHDQLFVNNLVHSGTDSQKGRILPKVCSGEWVGCLGMSEPDYGDHKRDYRRRWHSCGCRLAIRKDRYRRQGEGGDHDIPS